MKILNKSNQKKDKLFRTSPTHVMTMGENLYIYSKFLYITRVTQLLTNVDGKQVWGWNRFPAGVG